MSDGQIKKDLGVQSLRVSQTSYANNRIPKSNENESEEIIAMSETQTKPTTADIEFPNTNSAQKAKAQFGMYQENLAQKLSKKVPNKK